MIGTVIVNLVWMPGEFIPGDPAAWREEARSLLVRGELNVPSSHAARVGEAGQYYVRNEQNGLYYSKYGVANLLFAVPPMWLQQLAGDDLSVAGRLPSLLLFNLWNVVLAAALAAALYGLAAAYSQRIGVRIVFVAGSMYCTFLWHYQRAQSSELYQVLLFTVLFLCLAPLLRGLGEAEARRIDRRAGIRFAVVWLCVLLLVLIRVVYGLLLPLIVLLATYEIVRARSWQGLRASPPGVAAAFLVPPIAILVLLAVVNWIKFGAPWLSGYHQWRPELVRPTGQVGEGLWGFLFSPRFSVFLYFPLLAFAILGLRRFATRYRVDAMAMLAIFGTFLLVLAAMPSWAGEWSYGPRYLLFLLPVLSLPFLSFADEVIERINSWRKRAWAFAALAVLGYSAHLQAQVNRLPFFTYYHARTAAMSPDSSRYFFERHVGAICNDLIRHRENLEALPYFAEFKRAAAPEFVREYQAVIGGMLARGNLYWALPVDERR